MKSKIAICIPHNGSVHAKTTHCLLNTVRKHGYSVLFQQGCIVAKNRRLLCQKAAQQGASHVMFIDTDMTFGEDDIEALIAHNLDIVAANCVKRRLPLEFTAMRGVAKTRTDKNSIGLEPVSRVGTAFMLIKIRVFDKIEAPGFAVGWNPYTETEIGEDYLFCNEAVEAGFIPYIDHDVSKNIGHIGEYEYRV